MNSLELPFQCLTNQELHHELQSNAYISMPIADFENLIFSPFSLNNEPNSCDDSSHVLFNNLNGFDISNHFFVNQLHEKLSQSNDNSCILFNNIHSIPYNLDDFIATNLNDQLSKIIALSFCETRLDDNIENLHKLEGFDRYTNNNHTLKGGVACYIKSIFPGEIIKECTVMNNSIESLFIKCDLITTKVIFGTIYRRPGSDINEFFFKLINILNCLKGSDLRVYISGDFNLNLLRYNTNNQVKRFVDTMFDFSYYPCTHKVTRVTEHSATLIDSIWTNDIRSNKTNGILLTDSSDHFSPFLIFESLTQSVHQSKVKISYRAYNHSTEEEVKQMLQDKLQQTTFTGDLNNDLNTLSNLVSYVYQQCYPVKTKTLNNKSILKPWFSNELKNLIKERNKLYRKFLKHPITNGESYRRFRNHVNNKLKEEKQKYYLNKLDEAMGNSKKTWSILNNILNNKINRSHVIKKLKVNNELIEDSEQIANEFNTYFTNIGKKILTKRQAYPSSPEQFLTREFPDIHYFHRTNEVEIKRIIKSLKNSSPGHDEVHVRVMKIGVYILAPTLCNLVNNSFDNGIFPDTLKIARVTPIFKSGSTQDPANYRPISVLPAFSKVIERLVYSRMWDHLSSNNAITECQHGFVKGLSTESAIIKVLNTIIPALENNKIAIGVFLDLSKAFDVINHNILLRKLRHYGFKSLTLDWLKSYLTDRLQYTTVNGKISKKLKINQGVPQGSILGPLFFNVFINDLVNVSDIIKFVLYADDSNLFHCHDDVKTVEYELNIELRKISEWFHVNKLVINMDKTHFLIFSRKKIFQQISIYLNNVKLKQKNVTKFLGVHIDHKLTWKDHIANLLIKINRNIGVIWRMRNSLNKKSKLLLYYSLVQSHLQYGISAWGAACKSSLNPIVTSHKRVIRIISSAQYLAHTSPLFKSLKILKFDDLNHLATIKFVHSQLNNQNPIIRYQRGNQFHNHNTRFSHHLRPNACTIDISKRFIANRGCHVWNNLPEDLKIVQNVNTFKIKAKKYYVDNYE